MDFTWRTREEDEQTARACAFLAAGDVPPWARGESILDRWQRELLEEPLTTLATFTDSERTVRIRGYQRRQP